jgi:hypothetical protein
MSKKKLLPFFLLPFICLPSNVFSTFSQYFQPQGVPHQVNLNPLSHEFEQHLSWLSAQSDPHFSPQSSPFDTVHLTKKQTAATVASICSVANNNISNFNCSSSNDCYVYDALRTGYNLYRVRSPFGLASEQYRFHCLNNRCIRVPKNTEGQDCDVPSSLDVFPPGQRYCRLSCVRSTYLTIIYLQSSRCQFPTLCSSSKCQIPTAPGCGPCNGDNNACLPGTYCDTATNRCAG